MVAENGRRSAEVPEYELLDTGVFADNRYFDVFVEYAQAEPGDILMKITAWNRGGEAAPLHLTWEPGSVKPKVHAIGNTAVGIEPAALGMSRLYFNGDARLLFTENESNALRLWDLGGAGYFKDGFHERIVDGRADRVNPAQEGTKAGVWFQSTLAGGARQEFRLRLTRAWSSGRPLPG